MRYVELEKELARIHDRNDDYDSRCSRHERLMRTFIESLAVPQVPIAEDWVREQAEMIVRARP